MVAEEQIRLHRFNNHVAVSSNGTKQIYYTPNDARALARELKRYADNCDKSDKWPCVRTITNGVATTESTGKRKVLYV